MFDLYKEEYIQGVNSNDYLKLFHHIKDNQLLYQIYFKLGYDNNYKIINYDGDLAQKYFPKGFIDYHMEFLKQVLHKLLKCG